MRNNDSWIFNRVFKVNHTQNLPITHVIQFKHKFLPANDNLQAIKNLCLNISSNHSKAFFELS